MWDTRNRSWLLEGEGLGFFYCLSIHSVVPSYMKSTFQLHTIYQVGLTETEPHIRFFWNALESFSQEELRRFVKFACNQDRIPDNCPCKDGKSDTVHVPPYPMKIAPHEGRSG